MCVAAPPSSPAAPNKAALAFKVAMDEGRRHVYVRVYSGTLKKGDTVMFGNNRNTERIGRLVRMHANEREEITARNITPEPGPGFRTEEGALAGAPRSKSQKK